MRDIPLLLFLIGPRGSGKSTVGSLVAKGLSLLFYDTDDLVEAEAGLSIADIVGSEGWESFRTRESRALAEAVRRAGKGPPARMLPDLDPHGSGGTRSARRSNPEGRTRTGAVLSTGGGVILAQNNRLLMRDAGLVVYLAASVDCLYARLKHRGKEQQRPSLTGAPVLEEISRVLEEREALYRQTAHYSVDATAPIASTVQAIISLAGATDKEFL
jgi:shikimate kinase